jgi:hypothetical protein
LNQYLEKCSPAAGRWAICSSGISWGEQSQSHIVLILNFFSFFFLRKLINIAQKFN